MNEWAVVGTLVVLIGLVTAIAKPLLTLNTSIVRLTTKLDAFGGELSRLTAENAKSHDRIWKKSEEQDTTLDDHEHRITVLEERRT